MSSNSNPLTLLPTDPLEGLLEKFVAIGLKALTPDVLARIAVLRDDDPIAFEILRSQLKRKGLRVGTLDRLLPKRPAKSSTTRAGKPPNQFDLLMEQTARWTLFHNRDGVAFAEFENGDHREVRAIRSREIGQALRHMFFEATQGAPGSEAMQRVLNTLEAKANFAGPEIEVHVRVAERDGKYYVDLGDASWRVIEIGTDGWRVLNNSPVKFRRSRGMNPLPEPVRGGSISELSRFFNLRREHFVLAIAWLLAALRSRGPYPLLILAGVQGSSKSTLLRMLRSLVDPNRAALRALPHADRDLFVSASHGHVLAFDNVSGLSAWLSDTFCQLSTGGGYAGRQLFTDSDEVILDAIRPIIANGIEDFCNRADLADRSLFLTLTPIPEEQRRPEEQLWEEFDNARPRVLGALLEAMVHGLRMISRTQLPSYPRMADFARWIMACEGALWSTSEFWDAYHRNRAEAVENVLEANPVAAAVRALMSTRSTWEGTATQLLPILGDLTIESIRRSKAWPDSPRGLAGALRRAQTFLKKAGIDIDYQEVGHNKVRMIFITKPAAGYRETSPALPALPAAGEAGGAGGPSRGEPEGDEERTARDDSSTG